MELKGFSRYAFTIKGNELIVRNKESRKIIHPSRDDYHFTQKYRLVDDNGNAASVAELRIAYCLLNHCDLTELKGKRLTGTVRQPRLRNQVISIPADMAVKKIQEIEFALEKMKHYYLTGDMSFFVEYAFTQHTRFRAIGAVHDLTHFPIVQLEAVYDTGVDMFLDDIKHCTFVSVKPLFSMLCKSLKVAYYKVVRPDLYSGKGSQRIEKEIGLM